MEKSKYMFALVIMVAACAAAQVSIVVNKSVSESSVNTAKVASIFSLVETKWSDGSKIVVFDQKGDAKENFYAAIGKDPLAMKKDWLKKQLTGEARAPETVGGDADVIAKVSSIPGAVGYVTSSSVTSGVKVLLEIK